MPADVSWCRPEQLPDVMRLIDVAWKRGHVLSRDVDLLRWQYPVRDDGALSLLVLNDEAEGPVGLLGAIPIDFNLRGQSIPGAMLALWFVRSGYPDGSAGLKLLQRLLAEGYGFVGVLGIRESALPLYRALRFHVVPRVERWVRSFDVAGLQALLAERPDLFRSDAVEHWTQSGDVGGGASSSDFEIVDWSAIGAKAWDDAWQRRFAPHLVGPARTAAYLRWRYVEHPRFCYVVRVAIDRRTSEPAGLLVYRLAEIRDRPQRVLRIVEFLCAPDAAASLACELERVGRFEQAAYADFYCTSRQFADPLIRAGFVCERADEPTLPALLQPLDFSRSTLNGAFYLSPEHASGDSFAGDDVYFTRSDGDQDRPS